MATSTTLNVRMDAETKRDFSAFCDELGMSASSLMNVFARTVVRNQEVPFPLTSKSSAEIPGRYRPLFPHSDEELLQMLETSASTPLEECLSTQQGLESVRKRMGWQRASTK